MGNRNSSSVWLPKIIATGLPVPETKVIPYSHHDCICIFDGEPSAEFSRIVAAVEVAASEIGYPVFIRTDLASAKHSGIEAVCCRSENDISRAVAETLEDNEMKFWMERYGPKEFLVRKFLTLPAPFTAFKGLPISREFRLFASPAGVRCFHPYWPEEAFEDSHGLPDNWSALLAEMHVIPLEYPLLAEMAVKAATACDGEWSVDFAQDEYGKFWLLDMAVAQDSYHWVGCPGAQWKEKP